ncbi:GLPGLI family protein [Foetidibacter luteolus]|uniref:GLPGLI family protein n=1 Tax=Foetidibacter luteolus TaxID=2608880 RepID=UPI00129BEE97|nr:GLPGLI family protein [Foetidibacter luteolus]
MQKIFTYLFLSCVLLASITTHAQNAIFLSEGRIEFERRINLYAQLEDEDNNDTDWKELMKKTMPKFKTTYFDLNFKDGKTLYRPGRENTDNNRLWQQPAEDNIVFNNLETYQSTTLKNVYDQAFLVQDTTRKIKWKITEETRNIAGFTCRRANGIVMDSLYIVAFYTDAITTSGGPECFTGLPGMIMGVAIPREHITWFATKVYTEVITDAKLNPPAKGKKTTNQSLLTTLKDRMKDWGKWGERYIKAIML